MADPGSRQPEAPKPDFGLPELVDVQVRRIGYRPPKRRNFESAVEAPAETFEIVVRTDRPLPIRALGPVLHVGGATLTELEPLEDNVYRFVSLQPDTLIPGATITLGWSGERPPRSRRSNFRFERPDEASEAT